MGQRFMFVWENNSEAYQVLIAACQAPLSALEHPCVRPLLLVEGLVSPS